MPKSIGLNSKIFLQYVSVCLIQLGANDNFILLPAMLTYDFMMGGTPVKIR